MSATRRRLSQEFKGKLCPGIIFTADTIRSVADQHGIGTETLRSWMKKHQVAHAPANLWHSPMSAFRSLAGLESHRDPTTLREIVALGPGTTRRT